MIELWHANAYEPWIEISRLTEKEFRIAGKGKPIRGEYRARSINQPYGFWEEYSDAVADMMQQLKSQIARADTDLKVAVMHCANTKAKYYEALSTYP